MSDFTGIAIQSMFQRQAQERQFQNQAALAMLQSFTTGIETARTPQEVKKTFAIMNKTFRNFTKDAPGGPLDLLSEGDLENIQRLVGQQSEITSELAKVATEQVGGLMSGRLDFDVAMNNVTTQIQSLGRRFGQAEVAPFTAGVFQALTQSLQVQRANEASLNNLKSALAPNISSVLQRRPQLTPFVVDFQQKLDANSKAALMLQRGLQRGDEAELLQHWVTRGNILLRTGKDVNQISGDEQISALDLGQREWVRDLEDAKRHLQNRFWGQTLPAVQGIGQAEINADVQLLVGNFNQFFTGDDRISPVAFKQYGLDDLFSQVAAKYQTGDPTEDDVLMVGAVTAGFRNAGILDTPTKNFSNMTNEEWQESLENGAVDSRLESIAGPDGTTLRDLLFDETDAVRPWTQTVLELDVDRLQRGDPLVWDTAKWLVTGADFSEFVTTAKRPDGQPYGAREALVEVAQKSPDTYTRIIGEEVSSAFGGFAGVVSPLFERLKFNIFGRGGTEALVERDGRFFEQTIFPAFQDFSEVAGGDLPLGREVTGEELRRRQSAQSIFERGQEKRDAGGDAMRDRARKLDDLERGGDVEGLTEFSNALFQDVAPRTNLTQLTEQILSQTIGEIDRGSDLETRAARIRERMSQQLANTMDDPAAEAQDKNPLAGGAGGSTPAAAPVPIAIPFRGAAADIAKVAEIGQQKVRQIDVGVPQIVAGRGQP